MSEKRYYPLFADLEGRRCLVVGAGSVGLEKARGLVDCGAEVTVVAPEADPEIEHVALRWVRRRYEPTDLVAQVLVCAATSDAEVNRQVFADAEACGILCNVADVPESCSFILPAIHREGPVAVAVSTSGASPALAQRIRDEVAERYGPEYADLARRLQALRPWAKENLPTYEARRDFFRRYVEDALA
jgi:siroheme synthase-like protein